MIDVMEFSTILLRNDMIKRESCQEGVSSQEEVNQSLEYHECDDVKLDLMKSSEWCIHGVEKGQSNRSIDDSLERGMKGQDEHPMLNSNAEKEEIHEVEPGHRSETWVGIAEDKTKFGVGNGGGVGRRLALR